MWVRKIELNQVKCIEQLSIDLGTDEERYKWVTLLGDNGTGKTTILQALGLTLGVDSPIGLMEFEETLKLKQDPNEYQKKIYFPVQTYVQLDAVDQESVRADKDYTIQSTLQQIPSSRVLQVIQYQKDFTPVKFTSYGFSLSAFNPFKRKNSFFAAGYGAFRHISKKPTLSTPELVEPNKRNNFLTLFKESEALSGFHQWLITLDYERLKNGLAEKTAQHYNLAIETLNHLLPQGTTFHSVDPKGIWYMVNGHKVSASTLSDGYRSIIALIGDLLWRLMHCYPNSDNPLHETGVVLIDELAIHLHPKWQRQIAGDLQRMFPNLQFIVTTHSPLIAAGAGKDAVTYQLELDKKGKTQIEQIEDIYAWNVDRILRSSAFDMESAFSETTAAAIRRYNLLKGLATKTKAQEEEIQQLLPTVKIALADLAGSSTKKEKIKRLFQNKK
ncbi:MAG: AAA family ATPase [Aureispira sp.]